MKTRATGWFTVGLVSMYCWMPAAYAASPSQIAPVTETRTPTEGGTRSQTGHLKVAKTTAIARNSTAKPDVTATTASAKEQDKKTMGRCWKRLMAMARELNHAHRNKSN